MTRLTATHAPAGSTASRQWQQEREIYRTSPMWPGIFWGNDARCSCSWAFRDGVMQVKAKNGACAVHAGNEPSVEELLGRLIAVLAEAMEEGMGELDGRGAASCGSRSGYHRHLDEKTPPCLACEEAERDYSRRYKRRRARMRAEAKAELPAVAEAA